MGYFNNRISIRGNTIKSEVPPVICERGKEMYILLNKSIFSINQYGRINIRLKEIMDKRNITRNRLAKASNTRFEVIDKWYKNNVEKMDLDILARICYVLDCSVADIIEYEDR